MDEFQDWKKSLSEELKEKYAGKLPENFQTPEQFIQGYVELAESADQLLKELSNLQDIAEDYKVIADSFRIKYNRAMEALMDIHKEIYQGGDYEEKVERIIDKLKITTNDR